MRKLATALALIAMTTGSLVATEGASFAAGRHGKRPVIQKIVSLRKGRKAHKSSEEGSAVARRTKGRKKVSQKVRRHRKTRKTPKNPGMNPVSSGSESSMTG